MARIETYPFDLAPTVNDYVIGTDGDSLNATKNYKILTFLDFLGTQYNLNSTDLLFEYDTVVSTAVGTGYVSTNNYADGTILMSGVTNIYVSKITGFGQLVDDALNSLGTNGLSIMFADMGDRNNYGIFSVVSAADVDANTINLTVTATSTLGVITDGKSMGIRVGIGGADNLGNHTATQNLDLANWKIIGVDELLPQNNNSGIGDEASGDGSTFFNHANLGRLSIHNGSGNFWNMNKVFGSHMEIYPTDIFLDSRDTIYYRLDVTGIPTIDQDLATKKYVDDNAGADNLGNHTATQNLDMADFDISDVSEIFLNDALFINNTVGNFANTSGGLVISAQSNGDDIRIGLGSNGATDNLVHDMGSVTGSKRATWQNASGTVAYTSDIPTQADNAATPTLTTVSNDLYNTLPSTVTLKEFVIGDIVFVSGTIACQKNSTTATNPYIAIFEIPVTQAVGGYSPITVWASNFALEPSAVLEGNVDVDEKITLTLRIISAAGAGTGSATIFFSGIYIKA